MLTITSADGCDDRATVYVALSPSSNSRSVLLNNTLVVTGSFATRTVDRLATGCHRKLSIALPGAVHEDRDAFCGKDIVERNRNFLVLIHWGREGQGERAAG